jgi:hypothetical protein
MEGMLHVRLLGSFEVRVNGVPIALTSARAQSLLARHGREGVRP